MTDEEWRELLTERFGPLDELVRERRTGRRAAPAPDHPLAADRRLVDAIRRYQQREAGA